MNYRSLIIGVGFIAVAVGLLASIDSLSGNKSEEEKSEASIEEGAAKINWITFEEAMEANKKEPKKIFIDVYTDWCGWCKKMDKSTFSNEKIAEYINDKYYAVKLNAEHEDVVEYKGQKVSNAQLSAQVFGITGFPTTVFLDEQNDPLLIQPGFLDIPTFDQISHYLGENYYDKDISFEDFKKTYSENL